MRTVQKIRCASCNEKIGPHEPDLILHDTDTDEVGYYHLRCMPAACMKATERPGLYVLTHRYIAAEAN